MAIQNPRITLIATFYNSAEYLERCVKSLMSQSHKDYEILLVDDGSSDSTFERLQQYCDGDRIRCVTKENGGAGSARNFGVKHSRGRFVSFVDGDDYVSPYYLEMMDLALLDCGCDCAIGTCLEVKETRVDQLSWSDEYSVESIEVKEAIRMLAYERIKESACFRIAPRQLYVKHPFPERYYEDVAIAGTHFLAVNRIAYCNIPIYCYVMRKGSIVHRRVAHIEQLEDFLWAINQFLSPLELAYPELHSAYEYREALELARAHSLAARIKNDDKAKELDNALIHKIRQSIKTLNNDEVVSGWQKLRLSLLCKSPRIYNALFNAYELFVKTG